MNQAKIGHYEAAALREEDAAARATCQESGRIHAALAEMYRRETAKMKAVRQVLQIAFGD